MKRVVVTGAQGFVGRYAVRELLECGVQVLGAGRSPKNDELFTHEIHIGGRPMAAPVPAALSPRSTARYAYASLDLVDRTAWAQELERFAPDTVIHLASGLRGDDPSRLFETIVGGTLALIDAIARTRLPRVRLLLASTGGIYGVPDMLPLAESMPANPVEYYAVAKLAAEHAARLACREAGIELAIGRIFNVTGPGQDERHVCGRIVAQILEARERTDGALRLGDLSPTRDFIDVRDVARALVLLASDPEGASTYNIASGVERTVADVLECAMRADGGRGWTIVRAYRRAADIPRHVADVSRLRALGFECAYSLERSITDLYGYYAQIYGTNRSATAGSSIHG